MSTAIAGQSSRGIRLIAVLIGAFMIASAVFSLSYRYDNKYTANGINAVDGVLRLTDKDLEETPRIFLIDDWEIYRGVLLTPEDFLGGNKAPDEYTFIGQYGGFEGKNKSTSPHGSASYRLRIDLPPKVRSYTLELPEIYSAYRLYINGMLVKQMGEPNLEGYYPHTGNSSITVQTAEEMEILFAVSDYSYFYSGMVYPPAFGEPDAVASYINLRYGLRMAAMVTALSIGFIALGIRVMAKPFKDSKSDDELILLYALLCFCFVGYIGYPVVKTLFAGGLEWYYLENFCYCGIFLIVGLIQHRISKWGGKATIAFIMLGLFVCCCSLIAPYFLADNLVLMLTYSKLQSFYTYAFALFLTASTIYALYHKTTHSTLMTAGIVVFDCGLIFDRIFPNFEPIIFGWFNEISATVLVVLIGAIMVNHVAQQYRIRLILEEQVGHASDMLEMQSAYYPVLLEKEQEARVARHDLRHHFLMLRELLEQGDLEPLKSYLEEYNLAYLQPADDTYCKHYVVDMLIRLYAQRAKQQNIRFTATVDLPEDIPVENVDLCVVISNLLENALEASIKLNEAERFMHIGVVYNLSRLSVVVDNSFDGELKETNGELLSRKRNYMHGVGLISVKAVAKRYEGNTRFYADEGQRVFHSEVFLIARRQKTME